MGIRIGTNVASLTARRHLGMATGKIARSFERLATGKRIARAADDPAGLAIASRMQAQIRSLDKAVRNGEDAISLVRVAEGSLGTIDETLVRARELAIQASNGTLSNADRLAVDAEFAQLINTVNQASQSTNFNTIGLLDGSVASLQFQTGINTVFGIDTSSISLSSATPTALGLNSLNVTTQSDASTAMAALDSAIDSVSSYRSRLGAFENSITSQISALLSYQENLSAAHSRIMDVDIAKETSELVRNQIIQQSALSVLAQANQQPAVALTLLQASFSR